MEKKDLINLIMKAFAIYLFIHGIILIPSVVKSLIWIFLCWPTILSVILGYATDGEILSVYSLIEANSLTNIFILILYILIGMDLLKGGSKIKVVLEKRATQQSSSSGQQGQSGFE